MSLLRSVGAAGLASVSLPQGPPKSTFVPFPPPQVSREQPGNCWSNPHHTTTEKLGHREESHLLRVTQLEVAVMGLEPRLSCTPPSPLHGGHDHQSTFMWPPHCLQERGRGWGVCVEGVGGGDPSAFPRLLLWFFAGGRGGILSILETLSSEVGTGWGGRCGGVVLWKPVIRVWFGLKELG